jgi:hypothetical protein
MAQCFSQKLSKKITQFSTALNYDYEINVRKFRFSYKITCNIDKLYGFTSAR